MAPGPSAGWVARGEGPSLVSHARPPQPSLPWGVAWRPRSDRRPSETSSETTAQPHGGRGSARVCPRPGLARAPVAGKGGPAEPGSGPLWGGARTACGRRGNEVHVERGEPAPVRHKLGEPGLSPPDPPRGREARPLWAPPWDPQNRSHSPGAQPAEEAPLSLGQREGGLLTRLRGPGGSQGHAEPPSEPLSPPPTHTHKRLMNPAWPG